MIRRWWHARLRRIDLMTLWPSILSQTDDLDLARAVFAAHALNDPAWLSLGRDEVIRQIDGMQ